MIWLLFILVSISTSAFALIFQKKFASNEKTNPIAGSVVFQLFCGVLIGIFGILIGKLNIEIDLNTLLPNLVIMTVAYLLGTIFTFKALKLVDASVYRIISGNKTVISIFLSVLIFSTSLNIYQALGIFLILLATAVVHFKDKTSFKFNKGFVFCLLAALSYGVAIANDAFLVKQVEVYMYSAIAFILPALATVVFFPKDSFDLIKAPKSYLNKSSIISFVLYAISALTFYGALNSATNTNIVIGLSQLSSIATVILAIIILKEKSNMARKIIAAILGVSGLLIATLVK